MHKTISLERPFFIRPFKQSRGDYICIDEGISNVISALWEQGVITLGCCQGYKMNKYKPEVIIHTGYTEEDIEMIKHFIKLYDKKKRDWIVLQWRDELQEV